MKYITAFFILSAILFACKDIDKKPNANAAKIYEDNKKSIEMQERENPKEFLQLTGDNHRNFFGQTVYKGMIKNKATIVTYKDIRVKLLYFNSGKQVANHEEQSDKTVSPNDYYTFKAKYRTPKGTDSVAAYIMSAKPE